MNLSTSYLVRLYPRSDSGVAHDLKLFAIVGGTTTARPHSRGKLTNYGIISDVLTSLLGRIRLGGLVYQLGNVSGIEFGHLLGNSQLHRMCCRSRLVHFLGLVVTFSLLSFRQVRRDAFP